MKTKRIIIGIVFIILYNSACYAQQIEPTPKQWLGVQQKMIKSSQYIFEGIIVEQSTISKTELTCSVIRITKIFRGAPQLKLGTIRVLTEQMGADGDKPVSVIQDGPPGIYKGYTYIIFGSPSNSTEFQSVITDNSIILDCLDHIDINSNNTAQWSQTSYKTIDSVYSFLKENGLTVQEEIEKK